MTKSYIVALAVLGIMGGFDAASADDISVSGNPGALVISSATAGSDFAPVTDATTLYDIIIDTPGTKKIMGSISTAMPTGTALRVTLAAPSGATSMGPVPLSVTAQNLVTGVATGTIENGLGISYAFSAGVQAGVVSGASKTVTLTISDNT